MNASSTEIRQAQQQLQNQGFYHGQIDGIVGPETEQAIGQFQLKNGLSQTATLDQPTMDKLLGNPVGSQSSGAPTVFHGGGTTTNPQPAGSGGNMPKQ
jgi:peptidoglycan hydrolase-like protein with peptidoglycan-binding domain